MQTKQDGRLGTEKIGKLMLELALPSVLAQIVNVLYNIVDRIYIGRIPDVGSLALTGVGVTFPIITIISAFAGFASGGGAPLAAIALGQKNRDRAEKILGSSTSLLLFFSVCLMAFFFFFQTPLLYLFGASSNTIRYASTYISIYLVGTVFVELAVGLNTFISCQGHARTAMCSVLIGAVINIGLEGIMVMGALGGALMMKYLPDSAPAPVVILLVVLASVLVGMIFSLLLGVAAIHFNADQTLVGTALNLLGPAAAVVIVRAINMAENPDNVSSTVAYKVAKKAFLIRIGKFEFSWFMLFALLILIASYVVLYKTRFGLRLMACGEHPQAADSVGINVFKMRYAGVLISGALGGLGGLVYITAGVSEWKFENGVAGFGFLALAVMIFGQWKPVNIGLAALLFGLFRALSNVYTGFDALVALKLPSTLYNMFPYIISLIVLVFVSKNSRAPKAEGIPYDKGQR